MRLVPLLLLACSHPAPPAPPPSNSTGATPQPDDCKLARDWLPAEMGRAGAAEETPPKAADVQILAWKQDIDERPLRVDSALLVVTVNPKLVILTHIYRHPDDHDGWQRAMIYDRPGFEAFLAFDRMPTRAELDAFLPATDWQFAASDGFRLVASHVCEQAWQDVFHARPWHAFP